ncbi:hypothetical protein SO802_010317 [Lithocarpus litseifolius]|uniref:RNase H type-1 domain-containing protein n=1 Tax=Lithocarpus litseifolius TaxID=425828 RepID=A0AAW2DI43_9ROSI
MTRSRGVDLTQRRTRRSRGWWQRASGGGDNQTRFNLSLSIYLAFSLSSEVKWKPLRLEFYKVNYHGAMFAELGEAGIGVMVRNEKGEVIASLVEKIPIPESIEMLEALVARRAAIFSAELGLHQVVIEGDSEIVFKALSSRCLERSSIGHIIKD